jgi:signal-transduction protein with cAMP-binding, CBS, and nucleotidyltransferase domain
MALNVEEVVMRVSELMHTPAVTCTPTTTVRAVAQLMQSRRVGSVVVIDNVGEIVGIVTDRDVALRCVGEGRSGDVPTDAVMTRDVATIPAQADIADAAATMMKRRVRRLPVTDELGHVHGVVALDDVVRHVGDEADMVNELLLAQKSNPSSE